MEEVDLSICRLWSYIIIICVKILNYICFLVALHAHTHAEVGNLHSVLCLRYRTPV